MTRLILTILLLLYPALARAEVQVTENIHYGANARQIVDVYQPDMCRDSAHPCPVVLWVHGGGWKHGDTSGGASGGMKTTWANQGIVMIGVNYRLTPEVTHPAHVEDVAAAIHWAHENAGKFGGDPGNISLLGHSAGAHLVALVATNPRFLGKYGMQLTDLANVFPIDTASFDLTKESSPFVGNLVKDAFGTDPAVLTDASPVLQVVPEGHYPPFIIAVNQVRDDAVATSRALAKKLRAAGTPVTVLIKNYPGKNQLAAHGAIAKELGDANSDMTQALWAKVLGK